MGACCRRALSSGGWRERALPQASVCAAIWCACVFAMSGRPDNLSDAFEFSNCRHVSRRRGP